MLSALISFLGGSAFRMIWGEIAHWWTQKQDHEQELARMQMQEAIDAAQHARNLESMRLQNELGVKLIHVQADAEIAKTEAAAWADAVGSIGKATGIKVIDAWNNAIRPLLATIAIAMVLGEVVQHGFALTDWDHELVGAVLGLYVADRALAHRGK